MHNFTGERQAKREKGGNQMQQPYSNNPQSFMSSPPVMTTKDLSYVNDMLSWNLLAMKKAHFAAQNCQDPEIKSALDSYGQMHQRHYQTILSHLQSPNNGMQQ